MMKNKIILSIIVLFAILLGCQQKGHKQQHTKMAEEDRDMPSTGYFGEEFSAESSIPSLEILGLFAEDDTVEAIVAGHIQASCKHSGCWMDLEIDEEEVVHVTFKDDEFTIPLDAAGKNAVIKGYAYREMIPVETLQNYAREEGKSEEEITFITEPEWKYEFIATGVIIEE
jgi:hypothetical protein